MPTSAPEPTVTPSSSPGDVPACWHVLLPELVLSSSQTPEEFARENPGLVQSGAPSPCSLVADGSHPEVAARWLDALIAEGWDADDVIEDDVYVSRLAHGPDGWTAGYLVSQPGTSAEPITQFQLYQN